MWSASGKVLETSGVREARTCDLGMKYLLASFPYVFLSTPTRDILTELSNTMCGNIQAAVLIV